MRVGPTRKCEEGIQSHLKPSFVQPQSRGEEEDEGLVGRGKGGREWEVNLVEK